MQKSSGYANIVKRMLSYLLAALVILSLPLSIISNNILQTLFSADDISDPLVSLLIRRGGVRDQLTDSLISEAWAEGSPGDEAVALKFLTLQDRLKITQILFPKDWVRDQVHENLDILISWIESDQPLPELKIDLAPLQENLLGDGAYQIAEIAVASWPECSIQQERQVERVLQNDSTVRFVYCRPEADLYRRLIDYVDQRLQQYIENAPVELTRSEELIPENSAPALETFRQNMLRLMQILNVLKPLPFLFLGMIMTLVIRSWRDLSRWWGIPLGVGALIALSLFILGHGVGPRILKASMTQAAQIPEFQEQIVDVVWDLFATILNRSSIQALFTGVIGLVLFILPRRSKEDLPAPTQTPIGEDTALRRLEGFSPPPQVEPFDPDSPGSSRNEDPER